MVSTGFRHQILSHDLVLITVSCGIGRRQSNAYDAQIQTVKNHCRASKVVSVRLPSLQACSSWVSNVPNEESDPARDGTQHDASHNNQLMSLRAIATPVVQRE